jgi:hypothetical protein
MTTRYAAGDLSEQRPLQGPPRHVSDVIRQYTCAAGRHGFRLVTRHASGHIFFEGGHVIHAEFGEDCGLRAVVELLRCGSVVLEPAALPWPNQPSLHLGPELLLSMTERDSSRVVRKVDLPVEPPPLPMPDEPPAMALVAPVHPDAARSGPRRAISGVMPRVPASEGSAGETAPARAATPGMDVGVGRAQAPVSSRRSASAPRIASLRKPESRAVVASRAAVGSAPPSAPLPPGWSGDSGAAPAPRVARLAQPTTMVRITTRGELLAARGKSAEQVAEAAAFIHGLANLIAADFGRHGRANVHLSGQGMSLLVARSEVNDIAAALGPTERVASLLGKVGLK